MPNNDEELLEETEEVETPEVKEENIQPVEEEPASVDSLIKDEIKATAKAELNKKVISLLLKNPYFWIILGGVIFFVLLIFLVFSLDYDIAGTSVYPDYYETACDRLYLVWENEEYITEQRKLGNYSVITNPLDVNLSDTVRFDYKEYDYDTYVAGIIWNDNQAVGDVDNETVYELMAIAARSRVIANLPNNCVVLRDDEDGENFSELLGNEEKYTEITTAVTKTAGLIISRNEEIINADYDAFTYIKKYKESNEEYNNRGIYYMMNKNEEGQQIIPADWVEEEGIIPYKVNDSTYLSSLSLYGAKYLLEKVESQYDLYRTLEYYYGRDIDYYTIDYAFSNLYDPSCSDINMKSTSLTKEEFIARVSTITNSKAAPLIENAGTIYDMGISNGVNPELVFIRASVEGYSPGASRNNFWGIGCTNTGGLDACHSYSSVSEGVAAFMKLMNNYDTLTDLAGKYAYLGDYWYNPGSSSVGGCYYAEYIYEVIPEHVISACSSEKTCTTAGGADCVATTEEDKHAYLVFQSQTMVKARKTIFGLDADTCVTDTPVGEPGSGSCTIWKQGDSAWGSIKLGSSSLTMSNSGCAVTSVAIAMSCSGTTINNVASFNPGTLVKKLNTYNGFTPSGGLYWDSFAIQSFAPSFRYSNSKDLSSASIEEKVTTVKNALNENNGSSILLLHFENDKHPRGHWVVLKSISGTSFIVYDPAGNEPDVNTYAAKDLDGVRVYYF